MADENLQVNKNTASAPATPVVESSSSPAATPAPTVVSPTTDDVLDLDSIYDLDAFDVKNQTTLSANVPVPTANLDSFRAQSGAVVADGVVDNKVLADLAAMAKKPAMPVAPNTASTNIINDKLLDGVPSAEFAMPIPAAQVFSSTSAAPAGTPSASTTSNTTVVPAAPGASAEIMEVDLDALAKEEATAPVAPITPVTPTVKPVSEAAKIEAELEANTIDLDVELKEDGELPDLFESTTPAVAKSPASASSVETSDDLGASKLSKIKLTKTMGSEERRVAIVQKLMKTDTIYNRADKKKLNLSSVSSDKKLKSPVEELAELTLEDWSRLGDIPSERAEKIKEKIAALGTKSIIDEVKGLNAWRSSPTHQVYLDLGVAAMLSEKCLEEIISEQKALNLEEWLTINQLNRELMI